MSPANHDAGPGGAYIEGITGYARCMERRGGDAHAEFTGEVRRTADGRYVIEMPDAWGISDE